MMNIQHPCLTLTLTVGLLLAAGISHAGELIANASVTLTADEFKEVFLGDKQLAGGAKLVPVDNAAAQADFLSKVLQSDGTKYAARWTKKSFREGLTAPAVKGSDAEVIAFVKSTPGAVGYVSGASSGVKVISKY
jgi:ABC-type phosphate transport system substrate-binding protein